MTTQPTPMHFPIDECAKCTVRGDMGGCLATRCSLHESWYAHTQNARIITSGDVINDLHDEIAQLRGTRKVLWNLLGECLPVIDALMQIPGDDDSDAHLNGLAGRINDARTAVQAEDLPASEWSN